MVKNIIDLHIHLEKDYGTYTKVTLPTSAEYCFECGTWTMSELEWSMHGLFHAKNPSIIYDPITTNGLLVEAGRCPYCMRDGLYQQIEKQSHYLEHVERHIVKEVSIRNLSCPHPSCKIHDCTMKELRRHFSSVHYIPFSL
jgi:hypothetical protein